MKCRETPLPILYKRIKLKFMAKPNDISVVSNEILQLIEYCLKHKTLSIKKNLVDFDYKLLDSKGVLKINGESLTVLNHAEFNSLLYKELRRTFNWSDTKDFKLFSTSLLEFEDNFKSNGYVQGFSTLKKELWAQAIKDYNTLHSSQFDDYLYSLDIETNRSELYSFNDGYSLALPELTINIDVFCNNVNLLISLIDKNEGYNSSLNGLLKGIRNKVYACPDFGMKCFNYLLNQEVDSSDVLSQIISGLYEKFSLEFYTKELESLLIEVKYVDEIISGLANVKTVKVSDASLFLNVFENIDKTNETILLNCYRLIFNVINSSYIEPASKLIKESFLILGDAIYIDDVKLIHYILSELMYLDGYKEEKSSLILTLIEQPHFNFYNYLKAIDRVISASKDIDLYKNVIHALSVNCKFVPIHELLESSIRFFKNTCKAEFDEILVKLLIDNNASIRFIGSDVFTNIKHDEYKFDFEVLSLRPIDQYKLWISICSDYNEPKDVLPCILPLLQSTSELVKEAFICKLEEYCENYGDSVYELISKHIDLSNVELKTILHRVKNYSIKFHRNNTLLKSNIKELDPYYIQNRLFKDFTKAHYRKMHNVIRNVTDKNPFLDFCSKVTLLKGGGWKMEDSDEISYLGEYGFDPSFPRNYFIEPEHFDFEKGKEMILDWTEEFDELEKALNNE